MLVSHKGLIFDITLFNGIVDITISPEKVLSLVLTSKEFSEFKI